MVSVWTFSEMNMLWSKPEQWFRSEQVHVLESAESPVAAEEKHPLSMMLPSPCLSATVCLEQYKMFGQKVPIWSHRTTGGPGA